MNRDQVEFAKFPGRFERKEAFFKTRVCSPCRHDAYAIGRTLSGVNRLHYRKQNFYSLPGDTIVVYPDELFEGAAGTPDGVRYRMVYIKPEHMQQVLKGKPLPFIKEGVSKDQRLFKSSEALLKSLDYEMDSLEEEDALFELVQTLKEAAGGLRTKRSIDFTATKCAKDYIHSRLDQSITLDDLEAATGRDRWALTRDFKVLYGTSPYRYLILRRLEYVRQLIVNGRPLVEAAMLAGFSDQSHMTKHFTQAYGQAPAQFLRLLKA